MGFVAKNTVYPCAYREHKYRLRAGKKDDGLSLCIQGTFPHLIYFS